MVTRKRNRAVIMPLRQFVENAHINKPIAIGDDSLAFWEERAGELDWFAPWDSVLEWDPPHAVWFKGGKLNVSYNCIDRHLKTPRKNKAAIIFEGELGDTRVYTYKDLHREVCRAANVLKKLGARRDEVITIYMPMVPETLIAMLACARIGVPHCVVFGGLSAQGLLERINDVGSKILLTCDGAYRKGRILPVIDNVQQALSGGSCVEAVVILDRVNNEFTLVEGRDYLYKNLRRDVPADCPPEPVNAEDPLFVLHVSGTDKLRGVVHSTGGYLTGVSTTHKYIFDIKEEDVYWCTADIGWITGHSYVLYGPLCNGATVMMYEGAPEYPSKDRYWRLVEKYGVNILYTSPTAIRSFMKWGEQYPQKHNLSTLRLLGSVGEPISPDAWQWFYDVIGGGRCPIVDTWWQTETGMIILSSMPGFTPMKPGSVSKPIPGVGAVEVLNDDGQPVQPGEKGIVAITDPWPAMLLTLHNNDDGYANIYWNHWEERTVFFTGDGGRIDEDGYIWMDGRIDDVLNISGHNIGTATVENVLEQHEAVAEAACVGVPHDIKGQTLVAFVCLRDDYFATRSLIETLRSLVIEKLGSIVQIGEVIFVAELPKTQRGKTVRSVLQGIAEGKDDLGDTSALANPAVLESLRRFLPRSM